MRGLAHTLLAWGPLGVLVLALVDSAGIPLPDGTDVLLLAIGATNPKLAWISAAVAVLGSLAGCMILFLMARKGGEIYLERHTLSPRARRFRNWFHRYGLVTVFIPTLVPIIPLPLKVFVISAGALGVHPVPFMLVILAARIPRFFALAFLGMKLGEHSMSYLRDHLRELTLLALALCVFIVLLIKISDHFRKVVTHLDR